MAAFPIHRRVKIISFISWIRLLSMVSWCVRKAFFEKIFAKSRKQDIIMDTYLERGTDVYPLPKYTKVYRRPPKPTEAHGILPKTSRNLTKICNFFPGSLPWATGSWLWETGSLPWETRILRWETGSLPWATGSLRNITEKLTDFYDRRKSGKFW